MHSISVSSINTELPYSFTDFSLQLVMLCLGCLDVGTGLNREFMSTYFQGPIPVSAQSKAMVCGCSLAGIVVSNPAGGMDVSCEC